MNPDNVRTKELCAANGLRITTEFECGHGIVTLANDNVVEVEIIAFSKNARYVCVKLISERDCTAHLRVIPDRNSGMDLRRFQSWIWRMDDMCSEWLPLRKSEMQIHNSHIDIQISLKGGHQTTLSSEMMLPYSESCILLKGLSGTWDFTLVEIGRSIEQRPIYCLQRMTVGKNKPLILVLAGEHGTEFAGEFIARGMLDAVLDDNDKGCELREKYDWGFVLNSNPDGNVNGWHQYNRSDWNKHAYPFPEDISWHHEFGPFLCNPEANVAPEAVAIGSWVLFNKPSYIFNMHSWEGNNRNIGAYRSATTMQKHPLLMDILDGIASGIVRGFADDTLYLSKVSGNSTSGHLGETLSMMAGIPSCAPEAHMMVGADNLRRFGYTWLQKGLCDPNVFGLLKAIAGEVEERYKVFPGTEHSAKLCEAVCCWR